LTLSTIHETTHFKALHVKEDATLMDKQEKGSKIAFLRWYYPDQVQGFFSAHLGTPSNCENTKII
jgi:hypothetical protein